jgi:diguanylate cyclase (GGDEF)-like protein
VTEVGPGRLPDELTSVGLSALGPANDCDREPIHLSRAIQPQGFLLAIDPATTRIEVASANLPTFLGVRAADALGETLADVARTELAGLITDYAAGELSESGPLPVALPARGPAGRLRCDLTAHRVDGLLVCEIEPAGPVSDEALVGFYQAANRAMVRLHEPTDVDGLCHTAVRELRRLTGYDRVMIYRFDADAHGQVVAEVCRPDAQSFLGLHYPAGDIPRQARLLYLRNWLRLIADVQYAPVPLLSRPGGAAEHGLDLSMAGLRSVSPVHLRYLGNMGVGATMTISLIVDGRLWGMAACHHDTPKQVSAHVRSACTLLGQLLSVQLRSVEESAAHEYAARLAKQSAQVVTALAAGETLSAGALSAPSALLGMVGADGVLLEVGQRRVAVGSVPVDAALDLVLAAMASRAGECREPLATDNVVAVIEAELGPQALSRAGLEIDAVTSAAAGALYLPLGQNPGDCLVWLRPEQARTVRWAGAPDEKSPAGAALTPRASFEEWREVVRARSPGWLPGEVASAASLAQGYPELLLHRSQNRLIRLALHDSLTGLPNRAMLLDRLTFAIQANLGRPDASLAVMFIDLDRFKEVNDAHGHQAGDTLLVDAAARLSAVVRPQDTLARMGGDEFVLLMPSIGGVEQVIGVAQRVLEQCRIGFPISPEFEASVSASVGIAVHSGPGEAAEILRRADNALYYAKQAGRDQIRVFGRDHQADSEDRRTEIQLRTALAGDELMIYLQPVVRIAHPDGERAGAGLLHGAEALVRWQHPDNGLALPDTFIPFAEEHGLIAEIGAYVLERSLQVLDRWSDHELVCAVNVSVTEVSEPGFASSVLRRLADHQVAPHRLCLEITETQMMQRPEHVAAVLADLGAAGVRVAIDDFGTGFSSLAYVRNLPAHLLKIDRTFVSDLPASARDVAVVASTVRLAHELGMQVVAEGVETPEQLACLQLLGCDLAQGYLLGRPVPVEEFDELARPAADALAAASAIEARMQ